MSKKIIYTHFILFVMKYIEKFTQIIPSQFSTPW